MSIDLLDAPVDTALATPPQATRAILLSYTEETITRMIAETKAVDANCDLATIEASHWKLVKVRTGLESKKLEMTEPWRKQTEAVNAEAKRLTALAAPEEKRLKLLKDAKEADEARLEKARLQQRYEARLFRLEDAELSLSEGEIRALNDEQFETVFVRLADTKKRQDEEAETRRREKAELDQARQKLADQQAELNRQAEALKEQQRKLDEQQRQQAQPVTEQEQLVQAAEAEPLHPAPLTESELDEEARADGRMMDEIIAATEAVCRPVTAPASTGDASPAATEFGKPGAAVTPALPPLHTPAPSQARPYNAYSEPGGFSAAREVLAKRRSGAALPLPSDVAKIQRLADQVRLIAYPVVESEAAKEFIQTLQYDLQTIAEACDNFQG